MICNKGTCVIAAAIVLFTISDASAQQRRDRDWVPLGCWDIQSNGQEVGLIRVDVGNRRFSALRLGMEGASARINDLKVTYPRGNSDGYPVGQMIRSGNSTLSIDLHRPHQLREIEVNFISQAESREMRRICAFGEAAREVPGQAEWKEIGCHIVDFGRDLDKFREPRDIGAISAVRLNVRENDVRVMNFKVNYYGGASEVLPVEPRNIAADRRSSRIDLKQGPQRIREIELFYETIPRVRGRAVVCVEGRVEAGPPPPRPPLDMSQVPAPEAGWERFACQAVDTAQDSSKIYVGRDRGRYSDIQVQAFQDGVRVEKFDVILVNQVPKHLEPFRVDRNSSFYFPLGSRASIETIDISYRSSLGSGGQAIVCLSGRRVNFSDRDQDQDRDRDRPRRDAAWKLIGCQPVGTSRDLDVYEVGRDEGLFRAIRFRAQRNDVILRGMRIIYDSGDAQRLLINDDRDIIIRSDTRSEEYDLPDDRRIIQKIELRYRSGRDSPDEAVLCIEGLPGRGRADDGGRWRREPISDRQ